MDVTLWSGHTTTVLVKGHGFGSEAEGGGFLTSPYFVCLYFWASFKEVLIYIYVKFVKNILQINWKSRLSTLVFKLAVN